jgi:hypothetical protein
LKFTSNSNATAKIFLTLFQDKTFFTNSWSMTNHTYFDNVAPALKVANLAYAALLKRTTVTLTEVVVYNLLFASV